MKPDARQQRGRSRIVQYAGLTPLLLLLSGCMIRHQKGDIITFTQSVIGIDIAQTPESAVPHIKIGYIRMQGHIIPTVKSANGTISAPSLQNSIKVGAGTSTHITEDLGVGAATKNFIEPTAR